MLCVIGKDTKETVLSQFQLNNLVQASPRTDGSYYVLKPQEFDAANRSLSDQVLATHNIANTFWTRVGNTARFSNTFAALIDTLDSRHGTTSIPPWVNIATEAEVVSDPILRRLNKAFLGIKATIFENAQQLIEKAREVGEQAPLSDLRFAIIGEKGAARMQSAEVTLNNLAVAKKMAVSKSPQDIKLATGWEKGVDGLWRYEHPYLSISEKLTSEWTKKERVARLSYLGEIIEGPSLLTVYPELENVDVKFDIDPTNVPNASFRPGEDRESQGLFDLQPEITINARSVEEAEGLLVHEVQHAIQAIEGFARGGRPSMFYDNQEVVSLFQREKELDEILVSTANTLRKGRGLTPQETQVRDAAIKEMEVLETKIKGLPQSAYEQYQRLAGEVEARNAEKRARMSPEQRRATILAETEDIAREDQEVIFGATGLMGYEDTPYIRYGNPGADAIGRRNDRDELARQRFDLSKFPQIGKGSDRTVFDIGDGMIMKAAHTARGMEQNIYEGDWGLVGIIPRILERGINYVVMENVPRAKSQDVVTTYDVETGEETGTSTFGQMISEFSKFSAIDFDNHIGPLQDALNKYSFQDILNYDVLWGDFTAPRNWGHKDGSAYHIDGGTFGGQRMIDEFRGKTSLSDPEFRKIYEDSKRLKKQFGDTGKNTMFSFGPTTQPSVAITPELQEQVKVGQPLFHMGEGGEILGFAHGGEIYLNGEKITAQTTLEEAVHIWLNWAKENRPDLFKAGIEKVINSPYLTSVKANKNYAKEALRHSPKGSTAYNLYLEEEALAKAIADEGAKFVSETKRNSFKEWVMGMWREIAEAFGIKNLSPDQIKTLTLSEFAKKVAADMFSRENSQVVKVPIVRTESDYSTWKRNTVTYRGVANGPGENNRSGMLGKGLYTAPSSNKAMTKDYGDRYFVVNARPKNPKVFNDLNQWEIWFQNQLVLPLSPGEFPDRRNFDKVTTIETEVQKLGYDGIEIKGREMVSYSPEDVKYFKTEEELKSYHRDLALRDNQEILETPGLPPILVPKEFKSPC